MSKLAVSNILLTGGGLLFGNIKQWLPMQLETKMAHDLNHIEVCLQPEPKLMIMQGGKIFCCLKSLQSILVNSAEYYEEGA